MVKCPKCKCDEYDILYVEDYDYAEDFIVVTVKAKCLECGEEFWVKQLFNFESAKNIKRR